MGGVKNVYERVREVQRKPVNAGKEKKKKRGMSYPSTSYCFNQPRHPASQPTSRYATSTPATTTPLVPQDN
ncbi:hypothetical protein Pmani_028701 [Petrolisthes manimaculis]|uniref:Uncharacterized protein n=1 Tax=Petrolisthes manimaculis TaxID=1843537 RepID=A0AAE1P0Z3_9EUCA|nr:hypothetical protein Pmani_028701 [Petrolisthes manimaculis]